jgi:pentose-5-phosphate-3-epimerase
MVEKIKELGNQKHDLDIEVDGGVTGSTIGLVDTAGANMFVSGSYIVKSENIKGAIHNLTLSH